MEGLRRARGARGMTQQQLAAAIGVKKQTVNAWEKGKMRPRKRRLEKLESVLGVAREFLLDPSPTCLPYPPERVA
jgi:transcriptional regulator with XRE-family HTH domain